MWTIEFQTSAIMSHTRLHIPTDAYVEWLLIALNITIGLHSSRRSEIIFNENVFWWNGLRRYIDTWLLYIEVKLHSTWWIRLYSCLESILRWLIHGIEAAVWCCTICMKKQISMSRFCFTWKSLCTHSKDSFMIWFYAGVAQPRCYLYTSNSMTKLLLEWKKNLLIGKRTSSNALEFENPAADRTQHQPILWFSIHLRRIPQTTSFQL